MKIALVAGKLLFPHQGGVTKAILALARELTKQSQDVSVISGERLEEIDGVRNIFSQEIGHIGFNRLSKLSIKSILLNWSRAFSLVFYIFQTTLLLKKLGPDIVDNQGYWVLNQDIITNLYCIKKYLILTKSRNFKEWFLALCDLRMGLLLGLESYYFSRRKYKKIITNSAYTKNALCEIYNLDETEIVVIPDGFDETRYTQALQIRKKSKNRPGLTIMWAGYNPVRKNLRLVLEYLSLHPAVTGLIVGLAPEHAEKYGPIGPNVKLYGHVDAIEKLYSQADIFFFPTSYEGCAKVILEALACGCCVVTTPESGADQYIRNGQNGFVVNLSREALFAKLDELVSDYKRIKKIGRLATRSVEKYTWAHSAQLRLAVYREVITKKATKYRERDPN